MPTYNGIEITEDFYEFFAPHFVNLISDIHDPREQDNVNLNYSVSSYLSVIILGLCQGATTMRQIALLSQDQVFQQQISFLYDDGDTPRAQNSFTNLTKQLSPQEFKQSYSHILHKRTVTRWRGSQGALGISPDSCFNPFTSYCQRDWASSVARRDQSI